MVGGPRSVSRGSRAANGPIEAFGRPARPPDSANSGSCSKASWTLELSLFEEDILPSWPDPDCATVIPAADGVMVGLGNFPTVRRDCF